MATKTKVQVQAEPVMIENAGDIEIPDLWHLAMALRKGFDSTKETQETRNRDSDMVLKVWHLAHNLKNHIIKN